MARRAEGSIKQRDGGKDAPWQVRVYKGEVNGKRVYVSATVATLKEAKAKRTELLGSKQAGKLATPSRLTLGDYLTRGSPSTQSLANGNSHAVSQYDVACYQLSNK